MGIMVKALVMLALMGLALLAREYLGDTTPTTPALVEKTEVVARPEPTTVDYVMQVEDSDILCKLEDEEMINRVFRDYRIPEDEEVSLEAKTRQIQVLRSITLLGDRVLISNWPGENGPNLFLDEVV